jgi:hypothetical protein
LNLTAAEPQASFATVTDTVAIGVDERVRSITETALFAGRPVGNTVAIRIDHPLSALAIRRPKRIGGRLPPSHGHCGAQKPENQQSQFHDRHSH